jgi:hypothetical protein
VSKDVAESKGIRITATEPIPLPELEIIALSDGGYILKLDGKELPALAEPPASLVLYGNEPAKLTVTLWVHLKPYKESL